MLIQFFTYYCDAKGCSENFVDTLHLHPKGRSLIPMPPNSWTQMEDKHYCEKHVTHIMVTDKASYV